MIRHVSILTLKEGAEVRRLTEALDRLRQRVPGPTASTYGADAGLRPGNAGFATCFDFADETAFRLWDEHPEHQRIRREEVAPLVTGIARCQFRL